ncbi:MAG TPA: EamA family transporter [Kofleriaceae bacterium]|nr:EamA family transporter [Kofleriaceae bacterium]
MAIALCYAACALIWGTTWFVIRESIAGFPPHLALAMRFTIAAVILWFAASLRRQTWPGKRQIRLLVLAGVCNGLNYLAIYGAEEQLPGGLMAVLYGTTPLCTGLAAHALGMERIARGDVVAAVVALAGVAVISWDQLAIDRDHWVHVAMAAAAVVASVAYLILVKRSTRDVHPIRSTMIFLGITAIASWVPALPEVSDATWPPPVQPTLATLYLAVFGSVIAFLCYFYLLKRVSLILANSLVLVQPLIALAIDAAFEHRAELSVRSYVGAVITLLGIAGGWAYRARRPHVLSTSPSTAASAATTR